MTGTLRAPRDEDAAAVAALLNARSPERVDEEWVLRSWTSPTLDRDQDARLGGGGYSTVESFGEGRVWIELAGSPSAAMLDWAEGRAGELGGRFLSGAWQGDSAILEELERRRFRLVRHAYRMEADLTESPTVPACPAGIDFRTFSPGDERTFYDTQIESFRDHWEPYEAPYDEWAHWLLDSPRFTPELWFLALDGAEPAGFAICRSDFVEPDLGWVSSLGVRRPWRRRGIGKALLFHAFAEFRSRGFARAGLGVDAESLTGANRLYESAGMRVTNRFDICEQERA